MKLTLKQTPEQVELVKAMASKNRNVAFEAQTALAEFIGPVLAEVINNAPALSNLFTSLQYNAVDNPSIPLDLYHDVSDTDYVQVFSQSRAGGLPTSEVLPTSSELKVATYSLDSAVSFDRRYAAKSRMDVVAKSMTRVAQEILLKQNNISASVLLTALAGAETNSTKHVFFSAAVNRLVLADLNAALTRSKRIITSLVGGTPDVGQGKGITDLVVSPEIVEELRAIAYNPINTKGTPMDPDSSTDVAVRTHPDIAASAFNAAGAPEFYGINIIELNELGVGQKFNTVFDTAAASTNYLLAGGGAATGGGHANATFDGDAEEICIGIDRSRESLLRPVATDAENGGEFNLVADDQYSIRQNKIGYFGSLEEGRIIVDNRALIGIIV